jgi:hypothetical protein
MWRRFVNIEAKQHGMFVILGTHRTHRVSNVHMRRISLWKTARAVTGEPTWQLVPTFRRILCWNSVLALNLRVVAHDCGNVAPAKDSCIVQAYSYRYVWTLQLRLDKLVPGPQNHNFTGIIAKIIGAQLQFHCSRTEAKLLGFGPLLPQLAERLDHGVSVTIQYN